MPLAGRSRTLRSTVGKFPLQTLAAAVLAPPATRGRDGGQDPGNISRIREESLNAHARYYGRARIPPKLSRKPRSGKGALMPSFGAAKRDLMESADRSGMIMTVIIPSLVRGARR